MLAVTVVLTLGLSVELLLLLGTPRVAAAAGRLAGVGEPWITTWSILRWPVLVLLAAALIALLYFYTPTVDRQTIRWFSSGAILALAGWTLATAGFGAYVTTIGHYNQLYGWVGGALVVLLWLFLSNLVLVLGGGLDAELTRVTQLRLGIQSESTIRVPMRDTERNLILARSLARDEAEGRAIREEAEREPAEDRDRILAGDAGRLRRRLSAMNSSERETPNERAVEEDFSTPADADFTTPGNPIADVEHLEELDEAQTTRRPETPGDPLSEDDGTSAPRGRTTPGDPIQDRDDSGQTRGRTSPGDPLAER
jgi:membrane protein